SSVILTSIRQLQEMGDVDSDIIRAKKVQYNSIVDSIDRLRPKPCSDPIDKLPPELFAKIIRKVAAVELGPDLWYPLGHSTDLFILLHLTLVSQRWMKFITDTPTYWTFIYIDERVSDNFSKAWTCLQLSKQLPITVYIVYSAEVQRSELWRELLKHRNRIVRVVYGYNPNMPIIDSNQRFQDIMRDLFPLPALESLDYNAGGAYCLATQYVLDTFPKLRELGDGFIVGKEHIQSLMSRNCKRISISEDLRSVWPLVESDESLRWLRYNPSIPETNSPSSTAPFVKKSLNLEVLHTSRLDLPLSIGITEHITGLVYLSVEGGLTALVRLLASIDRLSRLQRLRLRLLIILPMTAMVDLPSSFPTNEAVKILDLSLFQGWSRYPYESDAIDVPAALQKTRGFTSLVIRSFPAVQDLNTTFYKHQTNSLSEIADIGEIYQLHSLQRLRIETDVPIHLSDLPPCDILTLVCSEGGNIMTLSNKKARDVSIRYYSQGAETDCGLNDESWPCVETLIIPVELFSNTLSGFSRLRKLSLFNHDATSRITELCYRLAIYPDLCPALES
ncbi:9785_t:CDS:1, partial [Acaulospora colombiana]